MDDKEYNRALRQLDKLMDQQEWGGGDGGHLRDLIKKIEEYEREEKDESN